MWGKVKSSTNSAQMAKYYDKITWGYWPGKEAWKCLIIDEILGNIFFSTQTGISLISNLKLVAKVMPNLQTKLR